MTPTEFTVQMAGITRLIPEGQVPTPEQWATIHQMIADANAYVVGRRILELAENQERDRQRQIEAINQCSPLNTYTTRGFSVFGSPSIK